MGSTLREKFLYATELQFDLSAKLQARFGDPLYKQLGKDDILRLEVHLPQGWQTVVNDVELKMIKAGDALIIEPAVNFVDGTVRTEVSVSAASAVHLKAAAESLLDYPYGCAEQTASRLYGLLYAGAILKDGRGDIIDGMVRAGSVSNLLSATYTIGKLSTRTRSI